MSIMALIKFTRETIARSKVKKTEPIDHYGASLPREILTLLVVKKQAGFLSRSQVSLFQSDSQ